MRATFLGAALSTVIDGKNVLIRQGDTLDVPGSLLAAYPHKFRLEGGTEPALDTATVVTPLPKSDPKAPGGKRKRAGRYPVDD